LTVNLVYRPLGADDFFDEPDNPNLDPPPPPPNTKPGYNPLLDIRRPIAIENYLECVYYIVVQRVLIHPYKQIL
jgi:hypothetical protein